MFEVNIFETKIDKSKVAVSSDVYISNSCHLTYVLLLLSRSYAIDNYGTDHSKTEHPNTEHENVQFSNGF